MRTERKRYVRFRLFRDGPPINEKRLAIEIRRNLLSLFGEIIVADSKFFLTQYDETNGTGILQCNEKTLEHVLTAASLLYKIDDTLVSFKPIKTSGTIKAVQK